MDSPNNPQRARTALRSTCGVVLALAIAAAPCSRGNAGDLAGVRSQTTVPAAAAGLEAEVLRLASLGCGAHGRLGVAAWRLDGRGPRLMIDAHERFPMASTLKV